MKKAKVVFRSAHYRVVHCLDDMYRLQARDWPVRWVSTRIKGSKDKKKMIERAKLETKIERELSPC